MDPPLAQRFPLALGTRRAHFLAQRGYFDTIVRWEGLTPAPACSLRPHKGGYNLRLDAFRVNAYWVRAFLGNAYWVRDFLGNAYGEGAALGKDPAFRLAILRRYYVKRGTF